MGTLAASPLPAATMLTDDDRRKLESAQLSHLHDRYPQLKLLTKHITMDAALLIHCTDEATAAALCDDAVMGYFIYLATGCDTLSIYLNGCSVSHKTQLRLTIPPSHEVEAVMVVTVEREQIQAPAPSIKSIVSQLTDAIAAEVVAKVNAQTNAPIQESITSDAAPTPMEASEPTPEAPAAPRIRIAKGTFTLAKSNWMQSAKRYLKAVDPSGSGDEVLAAIVEKSELGQAHLNKALSYVPKADREAAREKFYQGFVKVSEERRAKAQASVE